MAYGVRRKGHPKTTQEMENRRDTRIWIRDRVYCCDGSLEGWSGRLKRIGEVRKVFIVTCIHTTRTYRVSRKKVDCNFLSVNWN